MTGYVPFLVQPVPPADATDSQWIGNPPFLSEPLAPQADPYYLGKTVSRAVVRPQHGRRARWLAFQHLGLGGTNDG